MEGRARRKSLGGEGVPPPPNVEGASPRKGSDTETPLITRSHSTQGQEEEEHYLFKRQSRNDFTTNKGRCISDSVRAFQTLTGWARLEIKIDRAKSLDDPPGGLLPANPKFCVAVHSDDSLVYYTPSLGGLDPKWSHEGYINIIALNSMIRFHVQRIAGGSATGNGFVEICAQDMPWDQEIEGWFELRFEENLQDKSTLRYATHCKKRDDEKEASVTTDDISYAVDDPNRLVTKIKTGTVCCRRVAPNGAEQQAFNNAGELYMRLKLVRLGTKMDEIFARALDRKSPADYGVFAQRVGKDMQGLIDEGNEVKQALFEDCALCVRNYLLFIIRWRRKWLSILLLCFIGLVCINEWTHGPVSLMTISLVLFVNSFRMLRMEMTCSGHNAPLTDEGFRLVALWGDPNEMYLFLRRTIEGKLGAGVSDKEKLSLVAERCFRDRKPLQTYEDLLGRLFHLEKKPKWIKGGKDFAPGALVLVNERHRAVVQQAGRDNMKMTIEYDTAPDGSNVKTKQVDMLADQVVHRLDIGFMNKVPLDAHPALENQAKRARAYLDKFQGKMIPYLVQIRDILTWKKAGTTRAIAWGCFCLSIVLFIFSEWYKMCGATEERVSKIQMFIKKQLHMVECGSSVNWDTYEKYAGIFHHIIALFLDHGFMVIVLFIGLFLMITQAEWMMPVKSIVRIAVRSCGAQCCVGVKAPKKWAFFRPNQQAPLSS